jgi:molybdenum cofactor biosynthesis enzyme MoaA
MNPEARDNKRRLLAERDRRAVTVDHPPFYYHVHLNQPCNQRCIMCVPDGQHGRSVLPFERFTALFEQIRPYAEHLTLIGGEPLMYPQIADVLDLVAQHEIAVTLNTNATLLNDRLAPRLLNLHELNLRCSIDAMTRETYYKIRGVDSFDQVSGNIARFCEQSAGRPNIRVSLIFVVMRENLDEVLPFIDFAAGLKACRIHFNPVRHVIGWHVVNGTGWTFDGFEQSCEFFADEYNALMHEAAAKCDRLGLDHVVNFV